MPPLRKTFVLRRPAQLATLASAVRCRIVESLSVHGASSVAELAGRLDRVPESLYYHIALLRKVGLVKQSGRRRAKRRPEAIYELIAPRLVIDPKRRTPAYREALADSCAALMRLTDRNYRAALEQGNITLSGDHQNLSTRYCTARLNSPALAKLNRLLQQVVKHLDDHDDPEQPDTYAVTLVVTPV